MDRIATVCIVRWKDSVGIIVLPVYSCMSGVQNGHTRQGAVVPMFH